ncbi:MAG: gamma carbonic anhydrase family protein [Geodermatophilaceae bacterium]
MTVGHSGRREGPGQEAVVLRIAMVSGAPSVDESAWIAPSATLAGAVEVGAGASIWYGAVLRADGDRIVIGDNSNVQDSVVVHADSGLPVTVGKRVTVGHGAVLHRCTVEDDVLIGMGAMLLNGSRVRSGCVIAAGAVVLEGSDVPASSLVAGVPGKVRRGTTPAERHHIAENAQAYCGLAAAHAAATTLREQ